VTVVATLDAAGAPRGTSVSAFTSVSARPPMLAVCLGHASGTLAVIRESGAFAAHVLGEDSAGLARHTASPEARWASCGDRREAPAACPVRPVASTPSAACGA